MQLHQTVKHDVVHSAVTAKLLGYLTFPLPQWMLMLFPCVYARPIFASCLTVKVDPRRIVGEDSLSSGDDIDAVVGMGI